jgi:cytidylate kinase
VREQLIDSIDERARSRWTEALRRASEGSRIGNQEYLHHLRQVVLALGHLGHAIIMGRGAQYILPAEGSLRVRIVAPLLQRMQQVADRGGITLLEAQREIERVDSERANFIRKTFNREPAECLNYDLVLNMAAFSLESATHIVLEALREKLSVVPNEVACTA